MPDNKTIEKVAVKASFAEAEEMDVAYYRLCGSQSGKKNMKQGWKKFSEGQH
jgi:hypothetical protein